MRLAKRVGWGVSIKRGEHIKWLYRQRGGWFGATGVFWQCKEVNAQWLRKFISDFLSKEKVSFSVEQHSTNSTGESDENIPSYIILYREFEEWKTATPTTNTQQQENRIVNEVVQQSLMEPRNPLYSTGAPL